MARPLFSDFARSIAAFCPTAWAINYTNPLSLCIKAPYDAFPKIKAFECSHEVFGTQDLIREIASNDLQEEKRRREDSKVNVPGSNHITWFDCASSKGVDLFLRYGWITATGDRHLAEFMPGERY